MSLKDAVRRLVEETIPEDKRGKFYDLLESVRPEGESVPNGEGEDYDSWLKADLVAEADRREVDSSGTKAEVAERLREDDAAKEEGE